MNKVYINNTTTGGHWALKTEKSRKAFTNPMDTCKKIKIYPNDIIADIGAYVGEYSLYASRMGAKKIYSYEPTPSTFEILKMNKTSGMVLFNKAVVGNNDEYINLYLSSGIGVTNSIVKKYRKKNSIRVPAIRYEEALRDATIVKIDVEGAEYLYNIVQPQLRAIILEFHPIKNKPWETWADKIMKNIEKEGFVPIVKPGFNHGWDLIGSWEHES